MFTWEIDDFDENGKLVILYRHQRIIDEGIVKKGDRLLDVGGWGKLEYRLSQEGCRVCSMDIDRSMCKGLRKKYGLAFDIVNGDAISLPFKNGVFNTVTCFEVIEHLKPWKRPKIMKEISRVLIQRGNFAGTIPIPGCCHAKDDLTVDFITPDELIILMSEHFSDISVEPTGSIKKENGASSWYFRSNKP
jgi:ubiquinone/menaquinone biosynthesis C-methylase UbiE